MFFRVFSSFCQLHRAFRSHFCGCYPFLCLLLRVIARRDFLRISGDCQSPLPNTIRFHVGSDIGGLVLRRHSLYVRVHSPSRPMFFSCIRPILADRKTPPRPLGLNAGVVISGVASLCSLRRISFDIFG